MACFKAVLAALLAFSFAVRSCWGWALLFVLGWEGCPGAVPVNVLRAGY